MKNINLFLFFLLECILFSVKAQISPQQKDSILQIYSSISGTEKLQKIDQLVNYYHQNQLDSAKYYNDILLHEAQQQADQKYIALYYYNLGIYNTFQTKYIEAVINFNQAAKLQREAHLTNDLADTYKAIAGNYYYIEKYDKALEMGYKTLKIYEKQHNFKGIVAMLNNLALIHKEVGNFETSIRFYNKAIRLIDSLHLHKSKAGLYGNLGMVYKNRKIYDSALYYFQKSIAIDKKGNVKRGLTHTYYDLANLYAFYLNDRDSANFYYKKSLAYARKYDKTLLLSIQSAIAKMKLENGKTKEGITLMNEVLKTAEIKDDKEIKELAFFKLYEAYKKQHKWQQALKNLEELMDIQDTINRQNTKLQIVKLEAKYQNEKKQAKIDQLELKQKLDKKIKTYLTIAMALLFLSFALLVRNLVIKHKRNQLEKELLKSEKEKLHQELTFKTKQLTSQALMMMQKNKLIDDILSQLSTIKGAGVPIADLNKLKRTLKRSLHSEDDWELFKHYFEEINKNFFNKLKQINSKITPAELKLSALIKLRFNIKETASLLNISPDSVKTARHILRKKLSLPPRENLYEYLNRI